MMKILALLGLSLACVMAYPNLMTPQHQMGHHRLQQPMTGWNPMMGVNPMMWRQPHRPMMGPRPTGRPAPLTHDGVQMHPFGSPEFLKDLHAMMAEWKKEKMAETKQTAGDSEEEDETAVLSQNTVKEHMQAMRKQFAALMRGRPTGQPQQFLDALKQKFQEAKKHIFSFRPTGRPTDHPDFRQWNKWLGKAKQVHSHSRQRVYAAIKAQKKKAAMQAAKAAKAAKAAAASNKEEDETAVISKHPMKEHMQTMRKQFAALMRGRPTGQPAKQFLDTLKQKFKEARKHIFSFRPTGMPTDQPLPNRLSKWLNRAKQVHSNYRQKVYAAMRAQKKMAAMQAAKAAKAAKAAAAKEE